MKFRLLALLLPVTALILSSCTEGSGSDSEDNGDTAPLENACSVLGLGTRSSSNLRIINGTACTENNSPVVEVIVQTPTEAFLCSGTLITTTDVLTAAHCFLNKQVVRTVIISNGRTISGSPQVHPDAEIISGGTQALFDVAVVRLASAVNLPTVPILVSETINEDDIFSIFGYGLDENGNKEVLRSGQAEVASVTDQFIGANFTGEGSNSCSGDSGGPAIKSIERNGTTQSGIVGVVSSGSVSCGVGDFALYANITSPAMLNFLQSAAPGLNLL